MQNEKRRWKTSIFGAKIAAQKPLQNTKKSKKEEKTKKMSK